MHLRMVYFFERTFMFPSFELFGKEISMYLVMSLVGMFAAGLFACYWAKKKSLSVDSVIVILLWSAVGVLVGGHVLYGITNIQYIPVVVEYIGKYDDFGDFFKDVVYIFGGSVFYGGLLGGMFAAWIYMRRKKLPMRRYTDVIAPAVPLFHAFGRVGCFCGGCCYGIESDFGFTSTHSLVPTGDGVSRFPVQLLESGLNLALFVVLAILLKKNVAKGKLLEIYLLSYAVIRFSDEFLRGDTYRGFVFGLSTSQFISLLIAAAVIIINAVGFIRKKRAPAEEAPEQA